MNETNYMRGTLCCTVLWGIRLTKLYYPEDALRVSGKGFAKLRAVCLVWNNKMHIFILIFLDTKYSIY